MAQPWEWLNKYLTGQNLPIMDSEKRYLTKGLFGKGGEYGQGGLFTTPPEDSGKGRILEMDKKSGYVFEHEDKEGFIPEIMEEPNEDEFIKTEGGWLTTEEN